MRRLELFSAIAASVLTLGAVGWIFFVPIATSELITPEQTIVHRIYALDQGAGPVVACMAFFVTLVALLLSSVIAHVKRTPQSRSMGVVMLGALYLFASMELIRFIGGAAQPAAIAALICAILAAFPSRRAVPDIATQRP